MLKEQRRYVRGSYLENVVDQASEEGASCGFEMQPGFRKHKSHFVR